MLKALVIGLRPRHWIKNILVVVGLVYAKRITDLDALSRVGFAFLAFCAAASAIYLFNDLVDVKEDRVHPKKKHRPIASGALPVPLAIVAAIVLTTVSMGLGIWLSQGAPKQAVSDFTQSATAFQYFLGSYLLLNVAYTLGLKRVVIADVIVIALGFLIRVIAGTAVIEIEVSSWLILCTFYLALFLALAKRRGEFVITQTSGSGRSVLKEYNLKLLDVLIGLAAVAALLTYSMYTAAPETVARINTRNLLFTVPIAFYGIGRYLYAIYKQDEGEDPVALFYRDPNLWLAVLIWMMVSALVLYTAPSL